jgi:hypothetical protein
MIVNRSARYGSTLAHVADVDVILNQHHHWAAARRAVEDAVPVQDDLVKPVGLRLSERSPVQ